MNIGEIISAERRGLGLTQEDVAARASLSRSQLAGIETDRSSPTVETLSRIAHGMGRRLVISFEPSDE